MNLSKLTDTELDASAIVAAKNERAALHIVLEHLAEVQRRKSFTPRFRSIHAYAVAELKYDDKSAWRRVNAMFLMIQLPEIKPAIQNGELDLSKLVLVQNHIRNENQSSKKAKEPTLFCPEKAQSKLTKNEKLQVVQSVMGQTSRETIRILAKQSRAPHPKVPDQVKPLLQDSNKVTLTLSDEDLKIISELKDLLKHKHPQASLSEIVSIALNEARDFIAEKKSGKKTKTRRAADEPAASEVKRAPTARLKREVYERAKGACEICGSKCAIEYDHQIPWAMGGQTSFENMRLLCRNCNQREAIKIFGASKVGPTEQRRAP